MGTDMNILDLLVLNLGYVESHRTWTVKGLASPFARIYYVEKGHGWITLPSGKFEVTPGHLYLVPAFVTHSYVCDPGSGLYYLFVYEELKNQVDLFDMYDFPFEVPVEDDALFLFRYFCRTFPDLALRLERSDPQGYDNHESFAMFAKRYRGMHTYERIQLRGMVYIVFSKFINGAKPKMWTEDTRIQKVLKYIQAHLEEEINVDSLADVACLTTPYLIRQFKQSIGMAPLQYITHKKLEKAQLLLVTDYRSVQEIAHSVGYTDGSYFIRLFKKKIGMTPQEYRTKMR
ncbi:MAG: AraC family transcriptional regulator [Bacteroidaceae bacterium]|jgi:AraC-like DNA-binding protein|nr:AraC family transcriptional regulator [Bacteroidaceae bacterium]